MTIEKQGVLSMSVTPFKANGDFDVEGFRRHLRFQAEGGVGVFILSYGSGEGHQVTHKERCEIYAIAAKELRGKVPVYAAGQGLGPATKASIDQARDIAATGIEAIQLHAPRPAYPAAAAKPAEVERYFRDVLEAVDHPWYLAVHSMAVPGVEPRPELLRTLADTYPHLIGFQFAMPLPYVRRAFDALRGSKASFRTGGPALLMETLALGGHGALLNEPNMCPRFAESIVEDWRAGRANEAAAKWDKLTRMAEIIGRYRNPVSIKTAMNILGLPGGFVRRPYLELDDAAKKDIAETFERLGVRTWDASAVK